MRVLLFVGALLLSPQERLETPELQTGFGGTYVEALRAIQRLSNGEEPARAARIADDLVADEERALSEPQCAELRYAAGVAWARADRPLDARGAFHSARALAGPGELRRDATYNLGVLRLEQAEELRARLLDPGAQAPAAPTAAAEEEADPIAVARAVYRQAKKLLVECLRADWRDERTRANLELIQRRLRELDELERQQEEQQEEQQEQNAQQGEQGGDPERREEDQDQEQEDQEDSSDENQEKDARQETGESAPPREVLQQELPEGQDRFSEQPAERHLTREEVMRLLDKLADIDEEGELLRQLLKKSERIPVEKDW
ncbi:MAG: hypothetical protein O7B99_00990 [Planctomycetota bacterium]|nr:hypothetical protein [Planctomycetota bacterium]